MNKNRLPEARLSHQDGIEKGSTKRLQHWGVWVQFDQSKALIKSLKKTPLRNSTTSLGMMNISTYNEAVS